MKFAFSTERFSDGNFATMAATAREVGYEGVEVSGVAGGSGASAELALGDLAGNRGICDAFAGAGVEIACIAAPVRCAGRRPTDSKRAEELRRWIDLAADLACTRVMILDPEIRRGQSSMAAGMALGDWLAMPADHALSRGVTLVVRNDSTLNSAREMWTMLERLQHPAVACCWDLRNAVRAGESPSVSVPTLNSRIQYARVGDVKSAPTAPVATAMFGEGHAHLELFLTRLCGIGYDGYVTLAGSSSSSAEPISRGPLKVALEILKAGSSAKGGKQETRPRAG